MKSIDTIMGVVVADALGVPVEFKSRQTLSLDPVTDMREYGTHFQPRGTWSDDSSLTLATMDSLIHGLDYDDMMDRFVSWYRDHDYTPHQEVFDIGIATSEALYRYLGNTPALYSGSTNERSNGNGSLMRIAPVALYLLANGHDLKDDDIEGYDIIHKISGLTHRHPRSQVACGIYCRILQDLIRRHDELKHKEAIVTQAIDDVLYIYSTYDFSEGIKQEVDTYAKLVDQCTFTSQDLSAIQSSGYVVHSLEAAIYCFMMTDNYKDCVLMAVNLGDDTDTVAAIAGGLAGAYYGLEAIPEEWQNVIARYEWISDLCTAFDQSLLQ